MPSQCATVYCTFSVVLWMLAPLHCGIGFQTGINAKNGSKECNNFCPVLTRCCLFICSFKNSLSLTAKERSSYSSLMERLTQWFDL